ncbi:hypothetical protein OIU77_015172 [Salix suchowensis]|uniref:Uncharacterized protein n=1 Tax=Salix suchowensis TaxID=1278906 RepID=A0ABQ8ZS68_9ROSI|nr:hypothetical protein OIU77_015172 [Salix suchowensis]
MTPSPSSSRKSERIEKQTPPTIPTRKSERLAEKQSLSTPSRRPERGKNQSASSSPGSKKSGKSLGSSIAKEKHKKVKSVKQLETEEVGNSDKPVIKTGLVGIKRMDARAYRELFKQKQNKAKLEGSQNLIVNKTPGVDTEAKSGYKVMSSKQKRSIDDLNFDVESVDSVDSCSERQRLKKRSKVIDNNTDSPSLKAALKGTSGAPVHKMSQVMPSSADLNTTDENHVSNGTLLTSKLSQVLKADMVGGGACIICRPLDIAEENGCVLSVKDGELDIRSSISIPISVIDSGKIHCISAKLLEVLSGIANFRSKFRKLPLQLKCLEENIVESWGSMGDMWMTLRNVMS